MSDFWARKVRTYFAKLDLNNDGFFSKKDAEDMSDRFSDAENTSQEQRQQVKRDFVELWRRYMKSAVGSDDNGLLTPSILIASIDQQRNDPEFKEAYFKMAHSFFDVLDLNGDGYLSKYEIARVFTEAGFEDDSFVHAACEHMDVNKDGKLSIDEYTSGEYKYLTTKDEHLLFGPLVD